MAALTLFDTDVLIDFLRGHSDAQAEVVAVPLESRAVSSVTAMELFIGARDRLELQAIEAFVAQSFAEIVEVNDEASRLARSLVATYSLSHGLRVGDALIAATARLRGAKLVTGNLRHFTFIPELDADLPAYRKTEPKDQLPR